MRARAAQRMAAALIALLAAASHAGEGDLAPDFSRPDLDGATVQLAAYRGKLVLLNFWASWCAPCLEEMPRFSEWQRAYGARGLQVVGISMDDEVAPVKAHLAKHPVSYPIVMGDAKLGESFGGVLGLPTTVLIDPQGRIAARIAGETDLARLEARVQALLPRREP